MVGLRTQESSEFERFMEIVQECADEQEAVFFLDCGEGREIIRDDLEGEDLSGWLIPKDRSEDFEEEFLAGEDVAESWNDFIRFARWELDNEEISVIFEEY